MAIDITSLDKEQRSMLLIGDILEIWEASVRASHRFLTEEDIGSLYPQAEDAVRQIETLWVMQDGPRPVGFMGVQDGPRLECGVCRCQ